MLNSERAIESLLYSAAAAAEATVLQVYVRAYSPQGLAGVAVLASSHLSIHTWPEAGYAAADLYTCGRGLSRRAHDVMRAELQSSYSELVEVARGLGGVSPSLSIRSTEVERDGSSAEVRVNGRNHACYGNAITRTQDGCLVFVAGKDYSPGDRVFLLELATYPDDAQLLLDTDSGEVSLGSDWKSIVLAQAHWIPSAPAVARHSPTPNCVPEGCRWLEEAGGILGLWFSAARPISVGEEITWDRDCASTLY